MINQISIILLPSIIYGVQLNLYLTDGTSEMQYNCFRLINFVGNLGKNQQLMTYCLTDSVPKHQIRNEKLFPKFTFEELSAQNITSEQLYHWSAPIDLIEDYQQAISTKSSLSTNIFYNCTLPRFGLACEYEIDLIRSNSLSLQEIIRDTYRTYQYSSTEITCYIHLECDRGPLPLCLDWTEICDGRIDCYNNGIDEKDCWQLEINECSHNEFRCVNGQCIPKSFLFDGIDIPDCLDQFDAFGNSPLISNDCFNQESSFKCEDVMCISAVITSSCDKQRSELIIKTLYSIKDPSISDDCWFAYKNLSRMPIFERVFYPEDCENKSMISATCSDMIFIPSVPILANKIYLAYRKEDLQHRNCLANLFPYTCFNDKNSCYRLKEKLQTDSPSFTSVSWLKDFIQPALTISKKSNLLSESFLCNRLSMYRCFHSSKCISIHRLMDEINDCPYNDDENVTQINNPNVLRMILENRIKIETSTPFSLESLDLDMISHPFRWRRETNLDYSYIRRHISFQTICDGFNELKPILIDGRNETDETECEYWSCKNIYTSCNGYFNCPNGEDETQCHSLSNCSSYEYLCISIHTKQFICLPLTRINDGIIDCIGANDEPFICYRDQSDNRYGNFYCQMNNLTICFGKHLLCDGIKQCDDGIDEYFCSNRQIIDKQKFVEFKQYLDDSFSFKPKYPFVYFTLNQLPIRNVINPINLQSIVLPSVQSAYCHRGFAVKGYFDEETTVCFCPPSFYGNRCQYQNQRISLTLQFRTSSDSSEISFVIVVSLIDDTHQRLIHSYEQFTYLSIRDCQRKFHLYLLYSTRPKYSTKQYSIQIDIYEEMSLNYRTSLLFPIQFSFLPVHRLAFIIDIPLAYDAAINCEDQPCYHGKCLKYFNNQHHSTFCQCDRDWSGRHCSIAKTCTCSSDSVCLGITHQNRSVCICPMHKFGSRCLVTNSICLTNQSTQCFNGGQCIPHHPDIQSNNKYTCICPTGYKGKQCEIFENKLILSFDKHLISSQSIFLHFIQLLHNTISNQRITIFQTIPYKQKSLTFYYSQPFHLLFIEFQKQNYYLTLIQNTGQLVANITNQTIKHSDRCRHISELFNRTFVEMHLIRRIKYYHIPCRQLLYNLSCFYDEVHLCLCQSRQANCFEFNHNQTFDCQGQNICENDAQCFQDSPTCPRRSICVCRLCFYGTHCQFSTTAFSLSLDAILGYHIQPSLQLIQQPMLVQISILFSIIFVILGLGNSICVMITFKQRKLCEVGSGIYLLSTSITCLLTTLIFAIKFWILIEAQRGVITNRYFLKIQCYLLDFLLSCCLHMDQWLTACISVERAIIIIKSVRFNKVKSRQWAKFVIFMLILFIIGTNLHDPIFRQLINENNEFAQRIWCIVSYTFALKTYNYTINTFHFIAPFLLNLISISILFTKKAHQQSNIQRHSLYRTILIQHILEHKHLILAPIVCIILALPRIILSFIFKCMKSNSDSWLYLFGYFISLSPYILTFIVFILPSKVYMSEYRRTIRQIQNRLKKWTCPFTNEIRRLRNKQIRPIR